MIATSPSFSIYNASAGSGKTYALSKEYIKLLFMAPNDDAYKKILAITFTNKAVEEMKNRIIGSLYDFSLEPNKSSEKNVAFLAEIAKEINKPIPDLKLKSKRIIKNIIHNYAAFDILTIDKFTHKVIRTFAQDLKLPSQFDIALDTDILLQEAVDSVINEAGSDKELTKLLIEYSNQKADDDKNWDITRELFDAAKLLTKENHSKEIELIKEKSIADFEVFKTYLSNEKQTKLKNVEALVDAIFLLFSEKGIKESSFSRGTYPNFLKKAKGGTCDILNIRHVEADDIKILKAATDKDIIEEQIPFLIDKNIEIYNNFRSISFYEAIEKNINPLTLLQKVRTAFVNLQEEQQLVSIADFNKLIHEQIKNQPAPFIYERLGEKYRHFFIDEFQDTSEMQWSNLIPLLENSLSSMENNIKGTLMIVGDPKQSIYRWRGGKAEQFIALADKNNKGPFPMVDKQTIWLENNYRSLDEVVMFNNSFFAFMAESFNNNTYKNLYKNESFQNTNNKPGGFISLSLLPETVFEDTDFNEELKEHEKAYLLKTYEKIKDIKKAGYNNSDIAILTRKNKEGYWLAEYLTSKTIPILTSESLLLEKANEIKATIAWLKFLENNKDQEAKVAILYYLASQISPTNKHAIIEQGLPLYEDDFELFVTKLGFDFSIKNCKKKSLYETVDYIISTFCSQSKDSAYAQYFLDIVLEKTIKNQSSIGDFLYYWDTVGFKKSIPSPEGVDAVKIMSIHKSKGLEFPVVILPFMESDLSKKMTDPIWVTSPNNSVFEKVMIDKTKKITQFNDEANLIFNEKEEEELLDMVNVLYVAMTRPEEQLHIITRAIRTKAGLANNLSSFFIEFLEGHSSFNSEKGELNIGNKQSLAEREKVKSSAKTIEGVSERLNWNNIKIAEREALMWGTIQEKAIAFGTNLHAVISSIIDVQQTERAIENAVLNGIIPAAEQNSIKEIIDTITHHPKLKQYFNGSFEVLTEQVILKSGNQNQIPDRVMLQGNNAIVLDYKTGVYNKKHENQILGYANLLSEMGYNVTEKIIVYLSEEIKIIHL